MMAPVVVAAVVVFAAVFFFLSFSLLLVFSSSLLRILVLKESKSGLLFIFLIVRYNRRASEWVNGGMDFYKNATFTINKVIAGNDTETPGQYYPVRDSCKKKDDPTEGCMTTEGFFYKGSKEISPVSSSVTISIESSGNSIINKSYDTIKTYYYYPSDLGCSKDTYSFSFSLLIIVLNVLQSVQAKVVNGVLLVKYVL